MGASGPLTRDGLARLVGPVHRDAARLATWSSDPTPGADVRQVHRAGDAAIAAMCSHLATMNMYVYPEVARVLPHTQGRLARLRAEAHEMQLTMRRLQQHAWGDTHGPGAAFAGLRADFIAAISDHAREEESLLREFDEAVSPEERERLGALYERALPHAPSRPHPYLLRGGAKSGPLSYRLLGRFDNLLDTMDSRIVIEKPVREPGEVGPWGAWLLGRPPTRERHRPEAPSGPPSARGKHGAKA